MLLPRVRSFQGRIFLAILAVVLVPAGMAVAGGVLTLRTIGTRSGTLGAWDAVAETGVELLDAVEQAGDADPAIRAAAERHREALSGSVRLSRLYAFVAERFVRMLPVAALAAGVLLAGLALLAARWLSRSFGEPVAELAEWTERIAREEPLPPDRKDTEVKERTTLRDALRRMAVQIEEGRRRAVEHAQMRSWTDLARRVAHEIKNPLTPMRMAAATLARGREGPEAEAAAILREEIDRLDEMARTFSRYGRMPEGPRSRIDVGELLRALAEQHRTDAIPIEVHAEELSVTGHYDALERAFRNLLVNAVEIQEASGGRVDVSVLRDGVHALVRVEDRGPGVPEALLDTLWNPDVTTRSRGTGLGLAIVRQTIVHHDGAVAVRNREGGGAAFEVRLPATPDPGDDTTAARLA
ncbi:MAG TPA: HAMP domain-containing sensor histidine kinase [Longimicrobiales bacterium]|nr:HAMP domain-containing sensor histidine kinase [Longimicrobiales bacterium]